jgi:hypothetical protein
MTKFIKLLSITCALAVSTAVASAHCGKCEKKDHPATPAAPATAPTTAPAVEPAKQEEAPAAPAKKDGDKKCPNCPDEKPKAVIDLTSDDCPKKCDKDKKDAPAAPAVPATAEEAPAAPAKKDGDKKCPNCPDEKPKA